jgi:hypothetical protein
MGKNFPRQLLILSVNRQFDVGEDVEGRKHSPGIIAQDDRGNAVGLEGRLGDLGLDFSGVGTNSYSGHGIRVR